MSCICSRCKVYLYLTQVLGLFCVSQSDFISYWRAYLCDKLSLVEALFCCNLFFFWRYNHGIIVIQYAYMILLLIV